MQLNLRNAPIGDDAPLVEAARTGQERAFAQLFERHSPRLWPYVCALCNGHLDEAQDLLQEGFIRAWDRLDELQQGAAFHAWLRTLLYRLALDQKQKTNHRQQLLARYAEDPARAASPEERLLSREAEQALNRAVAKLSQSSQRIFNAFHYEDKSIAEISAEMNLSIGAVKARLFQGRKKLKEELREMAPATTLPQEMPEYLNIAVWGECEHEHDPLHPIRQTRSLLARRLLYCCRKSPKNAGELARLLHADKAYIEDILPSLVEGELLEEAFPGRYQTAFLFVDSSDYAPLETTLQTAEQGIVPIRRHLPQLREALAATSLCGWQGFSWNELAWIALPVWIIGRGLSRQVDSLPNWRKHRILTYPLRPVDHWYVKGDCGADSGRTFRGSATTTETKGKGMGNVGEPRYIAGGDCHKVLRFEDLDRFVGRLCDGPLSEEELLEGADEDAHNRLREYAEDGYLLQLSDGRWRLDMPVLTAADEALLIEPIDALCAELAHDALDATLTAFAEKLDELEFSHLLNQPHYVGFMGFHAFCTHLLYTCRQQGLMPNIDQPRKGFGCHAWYGTADMMQSWGKGR